MKPYQDSWIYYDKLFPMKSEELEFIEWSFQTIAKRKVADILDVACGTGRVSIPLSERDYHVTGIDISQNMLSLLGKKSQRVKTLLMDMREIPFMSEYDSLLCMNTSLNYLLSDEDITKTLSGFYSSLREGGIVVIEMTNFLSLITGFNRIAVRHIEAGSMRVQLTIVHSVDTVQGIFCHDEFAVVDTQEKVITFREVHHIRMLTYSELKWLLSQAGFSTVKCFGSFLDREEIKKNSDRLIFVAVK